MLQKHGSGDLAGVNDVQRVVGNKHRSAINFKVCEEHFGYKQKLYCEDEKVLLCKRCLKTHYRHGLVLLEDLFEEQIAAWKELKEKIDLVAEKALGRSAKIIEEMLELYEISDVEKTRIRDKIDNGFLPIRTISKLPRWF